MKIDKLNTKKQARRVSRKLRVRKKITGSAERPRLSVFRSNRFIYAQVIDDLAGVTLLTASSKNATGTVGKTKDAAAELGKQVAEQALAKKIDTVVFDKGWYRYHGRIQAFADAAREAGLKF